MDVIIMAALGDDDLDDAADALLLYRRSDMVKIRLGVWFVVVVCRGCGKVGLP